MGTVVREDIDVPMSRVVAVSDVGFTIRVKSFLGWKDRQFYYLSFSRIGGPLSEQPFVLGQITESGTLLRFYIDVRSENRSTSVS